MPKGDSPLTQSGNAQLWNTQPGNVYSRRAWCQRVAATTLFVPAATFSGVAASPQRSTAPSPHASSSDLPEPARLASLRAFRSQMGNRRAGFSLVALENEQSLYAPSPQSAKDRLLHPEKVLWRPGSTVKPFLMERLLTTGLLSVSSEYRCSRTLRLGARTLDCSHAQQPMPLLPAEALALSCNNYFVHFAARLPVGAFADTLLSSGMADRQPFGKPAAPATVQVPTDADAHLLQCLGESDVYTSPLALLSAYTRLILRIQSMPESHASRALDEGMRGCVEQGTGIEAKVAGVELAGKTGTGGARGRTHLNGWFLSYAPASAPRLAMVTFVENGAGGSDAAPLAAAVWKALREFHDLN